MALDVSFTTYYKCNLNNLKEEAISISMKHPYEIIKNEPKEIILKQLTPVDPLLQKMLKLPKNIYYVEIISIGSDAFSIETEIKIKKFVLKVRLDYSSCNLKKNKKNYLSICNAKISLSNLKKTLHPIATTFINSEYQKCRRTEKQNMKLKGTYH